MSLFSPGNFPFFETRAECGCILFDLDESDLMVDHKTYVLNLDEANKKNYVNITMEYSAKTDLNLTDLSPASWKKYVEILSRNEAEYDIFRKHLYRNGPAVHKKCNEKCKENLLCDLFTSEAQLVRKPRACEHLKPREVLEKQEDTWWSYLWSKQ